MAELPEVRTIVSILNESFIIGAPIKEVIIGIDRLKNFPWEKMIGNSFLSVFSRAKWLIFDLGLLNMVCHLRMSGAFVFSSYSQDVLRTKKPLLEFRFVGKEESLFFFDTRNFSVFFFFFDTHSRESFLSFLGPEATKITKNDLELIQKKYENTKKNNLKSILMEQRNIGGIGNIYASEILFISRINPLTRIQDLSTGEIRILAENIRETMKKAIDAKGSSVADFIDPFGKGGNFQNQLLIYRKKICPFCSENILEKKINGRNSFFCLKCQPVKC